MEIVYVDRLFFLNLIINYFLLTATGRICSVALHRWRYFLAAAIGATYSVAALLPAAEFLSSAAIKLVLAGIMCLAAFGAERRLLRCAAVFLAVSAAFGGAVYGASMLCGPPGSNRLVVPVSMRILVLSFAVCYAGLSLLFRRAGSRAERQLLRIEITLGSSSVHITALADTGNELYDPMTGKAVLVADSHTISALFPESVRLHLSSDAADCASVLSSVPGLSGRIGLIPFSSVGRKNGMLAAFRPDRLTVDGEERSDLLVAVSPGRICPDGEYSAIL